MISRVERDDLTKLLIFYINKITTSICHTTLSGKDLDLKAQAFQCHFKNSVPILCNDSALIIDSLTNSAHSGKILYR